jgi:hypothetical protein
MHSPLSCAPLHPLARPQTLQNTPWTLSEPSLPSNLAQGRAAHYSHRPKILNRKTTHPETSPTRPTSLPAHVPPLLTSSTPTSPPPTAPTSANRRSLANASPRAPPLARATTRRPPAAYKRPRPCSLSSPHPTTSPTSQSPRKKRQSAPLVAARRHGRHHGWSPRGGGEKHNRPGPVSPSPSLARRSPSSPRPNTRLCAAQVAGERRRRCPTVDVRGGGHAGKSCCGRKGASPSRPWTAQGRLHSAGVSPLAAARCYVPDPLRFLPERCAAACVVEEVDDPLVPCVACMATSAHAPGPRHGPRLPYFFLFFLPPPG